MVVVRIYFDGKLQIREADPPNGMQPRVVAAGLSICGRAAVDAADEALRRGAPLALVMRAAQRAASRLPARQVIDGDDGLSRADWNIKGNLWRPVKTEDGVDVVWELPGGGHARLTDNKVVIAGGPGYQGGMDDWVAHGTAPAGVAKRLVAQLRTPDRPTREQLQDALRLVPPDVDPWVGAVSRKGAVMVLGVTGPRGVDGCLEQWFVAAQGQTWRTNSITATAVQEMADRGESVVAIRRFMEAGGVRPARSTADDEPPLAVALRERDAAERRARQADEGAAQAARRSRALEAERDDMRAEVDKLGVSLVKAKQDALRVNAEQAKKLSEANAHIDTLLASERRLLDETALLEQERVALEQRPLCRTVTTVVRCKGGKVLERTVETQILTGERAAAASAVETIKVGRACGKAKVDGPGEVLTVVGPSADGTGARLEPAKPAVDMARVEAVVRSDLEATRNRWRENIGAAVILAVGLAGSVAFGVFVGGPMVARAAHAMGLGR